METPLPFRRGDGAHVFVSLGEDTLTVSKEREPDILIPIKNIFGLQCGRQNHLQIHFAQTHVKKWTVDKLCLQHNDESLLSSLSERIKAFLEDRDSLPKRLLFFVNPFGGKGKAEEIFNRSVRPLLEIAGIHYEMELTQHKNHALDSILSRPDLENQFDGIVSVGGDGMFSEVFNGVLRRGLRDLRVGIIPAGSTDAQAVSLHGSRDVMTCILHIILGDKRNVDVTAIHTENSEGNFDFERYSLAMASYGYFGDLLRRSESYRWMGPRRYDYAGFKTLMANRSYEGTLNFQGLEATERIHCSESCRVCDSSPYTQSDSRVSIQSIHGSFMAITAATLSCACEKTPNGISPYSHLGDGFFDLILVEKCSRLKYINYLFRTGYKRSPNPLNLSYVRAFKVKELSFVPSSAPSVWNSDGELITNPRISLVIHSQILPVFARGIPLKEPKAAQKKLSRFCPWIFKRGRRENQDESSLVSN